MASNYGKIKKSLSISDLSSSSKLHEYIKKQRQGEHLGVLDHKVLTSTMIFPEQYDANTLNLCVDLPLLKELEDQGIINWCMHSRFLMPLEVDKDGNSLLHSLSLYIFGVHDRKNLLRQLLYQKLYMEDEKGPLRTRWTAAILEDSAERTMCWEQMVDMASDRILDSDYGIQRYNNLVQIHVFTMANIIARPIIVLSNSSPHSKDFFFGGIYLPLLWPEEMCERSPVILGYKNNHFAPLISSENLKILLCKSTPLAEAKHCVPIVNNKILCLPLQFLSPTEKTAFSMDEFLGKYLEIINIPCDTDNRHSLIAAAMLKFKAPPTHSIELMWALKTYSETLTYKNNVLSHIDEEPLYEDLIPCRRKEAGCKNNASSNSEKLCPLCYEQYKIEINTMAARLHSTNSTEESKNINVPRTTVNEVYAVNDRNGANKYNKPVENKLNDKDGSREQVSGERNKLFSRAADSTKPLLGKRTRCSEYSNPHNEGDRGLNQNHQYYGDQYTSENLQEERVENAGTNQNKCLFCDNHGNPNHGGYCNECHLRMQRRMDMKCLNCENVGLENLNFLCENCHRKQMEIYRPLPQKHLSLHHGADPTKGATLNFTNTSGNKSLLLVDEKQQGCQRYGCEFFGTIEYGGYCSGCFMDSTKQPL